MRKNNTDKVYLPITYFFVLTIIMIIALFVIKNYIYSNMYAEATMTTEEAMVQTQPIADSKDIVTSTVIEREEINRPKQKMLALRSPTIAVPMQMLYKTSAKTYMDYRSITMKTSKQYKLIHSEEINICEDGFLRDNDGYIGVAMGSYFGDIGSRYICHLDNGKDIKVVKIEAKSDKHTIKGFCGIANYDILEFVIDTRAEWMRNNKWKNGYIFSGNFNNYSNFNGRIVSIEKIIN